jgi:photosystem II stability/assembly factor-like uncharacterized protein
MFETVQSSVFIATHWQGATRAEFREDKWQTAPILAEEVVHCLAVDPFDPHTVYAGTREHGVLISRDQGQTWEEWGLLGTPVKALAISPHQPGVAYAGSKPVSLYKTEDAGKNWKELPALRATRKWWWFSPAEPPGITPYVQGLSISPGDPEVLLAGIELGAVMRSEDGGRTWSRHLKNALRDCHSLKFHTSDPNWAYEGGGSGIGGAISIDGGRTWIQNKAGLGKKYGWMASADTKKPEIVYLSASRMPSLLRGEFVPPAHNDGNAGAHIYRSKSGGAWQQLGGGLPDPIDFMPYALVPDRENTGWLYAGLANGDVWLTTDYGDSWVQLPLNLGDVHRDMVVLG